MREGDVARPKADRGNSGLVQQRCIGPRAQSLDRRLHSFSGKRALERSNDRSIARDVARCLPAEQSNGRGKLGMTLPHPVARVKNFVHRILGRFARQRAALERERAQVGVGGHADPAGNFRGMD